MPLTTCPRSRGSMPSKARILILIGLEGPELQDRLNNNKLFWHPMATDPLWRSLVKRGVAEFLTRAQTNGDGTRLKPRSPFFEMPTN